MEGELLILCVMFAALGFGAYVSQRTHGRTAIAVCPRCGHGVERFPCWQCGYPAEAQS